MVVNTPERLRAINEISKKLDGLEIVLRKYGARRAGKTDGLADQEHSHTVPADEINSEIWNRNNPDAMAMFYEAARNTNDSLDRASQLGKEWARKHNPHYKQR